MALHNPGNKLLEYSDASHKNVIYLTFRYLNMHIYEIRRQHPATNCQNFTIYVCKLYTYHSIKKQVTFLCTHFRKHLLKIFHGKKLIDGLKTYM